MAEPFLKLSLEDRREVLKIAADQLGRPSHLLEKHVWVVWALATLFGSALAGTSGVQGRHLAVEGLPGHSALLGGR